MRVKRWIEKCYCLEEPTCLNVWTFSALLSFSFFGQTCFVLMCCMFTLFSPSRCVPWAGWRWLRRTWHQARAVLPSTTASGSSLITNTTFMTLLASGERWGDFSSSSSSASKYVWTHNSIKKCLRWTAHSECVLWQGKDMLMVLENDTMNLIDPLGQTLLHTQPIGSIRVWGVGRDNGRSVSTL